MQTEIARQLVRRGSELFDAPKAPIAFSRDPASDALLNDLKQHPHAFVLACVMDRQIKAERAWSIPHRIAMELGGDFSFQRLARLTAPRIERLFTKLKLHRFNATMSRNFHGTVAHLAAEYGGDARGMWRDRPSSAAVVYRFLRLPGVGLKIATMAANILARNFKIPMSDYFSIDISAEVHVQRVFGRLGLAEASADPAALVYRARELHPEFPGVMDLPVWEIGRQWCRPQKPLCSDCYMQRLCVSARR